MSSEEWARKLGICTINYQVNRKKRAARLCESIGNARLSKGILPCAEIHYSPDYESCVEWFSHVADGLSTSGHGPVIIHEVMKVESGWAVFYKI